MAELATGSSPDRDPCLRVSVKLPNADYGGWQGEDLWVSGDDGRLLHPARGYSECIGVRERVRSLDSSGLKNQ